MTGVLFAMASERRLIIARCSIGTFANTRGASRSHSTADVPEGQQTSSVAHPDTWLKTRVMAAKAT